MRISPVLIEYVDSDCCGRRSPVSDHHGDHHDLQVREDSISGIRIQRYSLM